jgi:large conductance mechanosensitive channel
MFKEFKEFVMKGNVLDMAVGIIIGVAFGAIVTSLVKDIIMPPIGLALGNVDFTNLFAVLKTGNVAPPYASLSDAQAVGAVTINYGTFINTIIIFIIVAFAVFMIVRTVNSARRRLEAKQEAAPPPPPTTKDCPYCKSKIHIEAKRCPNCTSQL